MLRMFTFPPFKKLTSLSSPWKKSDAESARQKQNQFLKAILN